MHLLKKLQQHFFTREFLFFLVIGCINTFNCSLIAAFFTYWLPDANAAFNIGYLLSLTFAYYLNSKLVFKQELNKAQYLRFCLSYLPNFLVQNLIVLLFYNMLAFPPIISYLFAAIIGVPVTFLLVKIFAFRQ